MAAPRPAADFIRCDVCTKPIPPDKLLCLRHWRAVPLDLQRAVNRTWRAFNALKSNHELRLLALREYRQARDAALAAVRTQTDPQPVAQTAPAPVTAGEAHDPTE